MKNSTVPPSLGANATLDPSTPPTAIRVLVVEDDALNRSIVCRLLTQGKFEPVTAVDGAQALSLVSQLPFDVILMDWQMPDMNGLECTRQLRAGRSGAQGLTVPIVALTANAHAEDRAACLAAGMDDFLAKPVQRNLLNAAVTKWARQQRTPGHPATTPPEPARPPQGQLSGADAFALAYDPGVLPELLGTDASDRALENQVLAAFTKSWPPTMQAIQDAIATGDTAALRLQAHTLKSTAATIGALEIANEAKRQDSRLEAGQPVTENLSANLRAMFERFDAALTRHQLALGTRSPR